MHQKFGPGWPGGPDGPVLPGAPRLPVGPGKPVGPGPYSILPNPGSPFKPVGIEQEFESYFLKYIISVINNTCGPCPECVNVSSVLCRLSDSDG